MSFTEHLRYLQATGTLTDELGLKIRAWGVDE